MYLINLFAGCEIDAAVVDDDGAPARPYEECTEGRREHGAGLLLISFAGFICLTALFVHTWVIETKGLTLEQLERQYSSRRHRLLSRSSSCCCANTGGLSASVSEDDIGRPLLGAESEIPPDSQQRTPTC
jgi:hypothetical protein